MLHRFSLLLNLHHCGNVRLWKNGGRQNKDKWRVYMDKLAIIKWWVARLDFMTPLHLGQIAPCTGSSRLHVPGKKKRESHAGYPVMRIWIGAHKVRSQSSGFQISHMLQFIFLSPHSGPVLLSNPFSICILCKEHITASLVWIVSKARREMAQAKPQFKTCNETVSLFKEFFPPTQNFPASEWMFMHKYPSCTHEIFEVPVWNLISTKLTSDTILSKLIRGVGGGEKCRSTHTYHRHYLSLEQVSERKILLCPPDNRPITMVLWPLIWEKSIWRQREGSKTKNEGDP